MATLLENNTVKLQTVNQVVHNLFNLTATDTPYGSKWEQSILCGSTIKKIDNYYITVSSLGILISTDGINWQITNNTSSIVFYSASFDIYKHNNIYYIGINGRGVFYSYDLMTWFLSFQGSLYSLYYFNNTLLCTIYTGVYQYSDTDLNWEPVLTGQYPSNIVLCQNELFVIVDNNTNLYASADFGSSWDLRYTFADYTWSMFTLNNILYTGGNVGCLKSIDNGVTWETAYDSEGNTLSNSYETASYEYNAIANKYIVHLSHPYGGSKYYYSNDLITLTPIAITERCDILLILTLNNKVVAFTSQPIDSTYTEYVFAVWETTDLSNWTCTTQISLDTYSCNAATYYNNILFIVTSQGRMQYSTDFKKFNTSYIKGTALPEYGGMSECFNQIDNLLYYYSGSYIYFIDN